MNWQLSDALGIFFGFAANLAVSQVGYTVWRWQTASSVVPSIVLLTLIFVCPESPRFLMKQGRYRGAYRTLVALRGEPVLAAKEMLYVHYQMEVEMLHLRRKHPDTEANCPARDHEGAGVEMHATQTHSPGSGTGINYWQKLGQLFTERRVRRAMVAAVVCMIGQQLCGVNVLAFYSSTFFCDAGRSEPVNSELGDASDPSFLRPLFLSWGIGLTNFIFAFPAYYLIDKKGRRWLLLVALPFLALTMLATSLSFLIPNGNSAHGPVIAFWTYVFMFFYSWSMGPGPFTMSAEVFPLETRVVGMSFAVFVNLFGAGLLTLFVPALTIHLGHAGLLGLFAGLNIVTFILVFFFVRETAGITLGGTPGSMTFMSLEELNYIFGVSTVKHVKYQLTTVVPWVWSYYVVRDETCPDQPEKLYTWASASNEKSQPNQEVRQGEL
ncbi:hypothetical protein LTR37_000905 [Vermiconidia calcicola]|uniref:Uncharacterized protein n=1 Tax=Vermiconidia calcicola TaxID=1690605 RepID=A0ACC3NZ54_9PEZI|nr:hypothetical protein LTR37_000905 [Vermiconidia calcicola]